MLNTRKISSSTQNQAINAIKFYYEKVRKGERKVYALERPLKETKLPDVLSEDEVSAILKSPGNLKHKTMIWLIYAAGLRRSRNRHRSEVYPGIAWSQFKQDDGDLHACNYEAI